jgi:hypothetical protein
LYLDLQLSLSLLKSHERSEPFSRRKSSSLRSHGHLLLLSFHVRMLLNTVVICLRSSCLVCMFVRDMSWVIHLIMIDVIHKRRVTPKLLVAPVVLELVLWSHSWHWRRIELHMIYSCIHALLHQLLIESVLSMFDVLFPF